MTQKTKDTITITIDYDNHDFLTDLKRDMQKVARGKKRITFDDALRYLKLLNRLNNTVSGKALIKSEKEYTTEQFVLDLISKKE